MWYFTPRNSVIGVDLHRNMRRWEKTRLQCKRCSWKWWHLNQIWILFLSFIWYISKIHFRHMCYGISKSKSVISDSDEPSPLLQSGHSPIYTGVFFTLPSSLPLSIWNISFSSCTLSAETCHSSSALMQWRRKRVAKTPTHSIGPIITHTKKKSYPHISKWYYFRQRHDYQGPENGWWFSISHFKAFLDFDAVFFFLHFFLKPQPCLHYSIVVSMRKSCTVSKNTYYFLISSLLYRLAPLLHKLSWVFSHRYERFTFPLSPRELV